MTILVIGGSGCGKSAYAESRAASLAENRKKYYLATMKVCDSEMQKKAARHRRIRSGKGWETLEHPTDCGTAADKIRPDSVVLLEDLGNLAANEMFQEGRTCSAEEVCEKIGRDLLLLKKKASCLIIVSNNVFDDGAEYDPGTMEYIRALGLLHQHIAGRAQEVTEVVAGIPVSLKKDMSWTD